MRTSIAMCTYNGAEFVRRQLDSFARQTCLPCELVVCDDGSSDQTLNIVDDFASRVPFPVHVYRNETNLGSTRNFERAISLCTGDLIALADQDDEWYPDKLAAFHRFFSEFPEALVCFSDADIIDHRGIPTGRQVWKSVYFAPARKEPHLETGMLSTLLKLNNVATGATMVFRANLRGEILPIPNSWVHDAWITWIAALNGAVGVLPQAKIRYRIHTGQQLGLDPPSLPARLSHARRNPAGDYLAWVRRLDDLKRHLASKTDLRAQEFFPSIHAKIEHLKRRRELPVSTLPRLYWILSAWRGYLRYTRGPVSMFKDMFFPPSRVLD